MHALYLVRNFGAHISMKRQALIDACQSTKIQARVGPICACCAQASLEFSSDARPPQKVPTKPDHPQVDQ